MKKSSRLYFAFGSNMLTPRLQRRCPSARVVTRAAARGYSVAFDKLSEDTSGKANLVRSEIRESAVGVVYELAAADLDKLDAFEGPGYRRNDAFSVTCLDTASALLTCTYLAIENIAGLAPYDWYLAMILAGLAEHDVDSSYAQRMRMTGFAADPWSSRPTRQHALRDLETAGYRDYRELLLPRD